MQPGDVIDEKYEIVRLLGEGGMGAVFEGRNRLINRQVAIKILHTSVKKAGDIVKRFEREAQAAGTIGSDHILEVLDLGTLPGGDRYMVLEFLDGETFAERIERKGRLTAEELAPLLRQALIGLAAAHGAHIIHRDLKPDNLFILKEKAGREDFVKIIDFGISKFNSVAGDMGMTSTGAIMGTPYYMSPEQAKGAGGVTHQSDIYSMGVIAYEALTGRVPFEGTSFNDLMFKIVLNELPNLSERAPNLDPSFARIVERALSKDTGLRYKSADEFLKALENWGNSASTLVGGSAEAALNDTIGDGHNRATAQRRPELLSTEVGAPQSPSKETDTSWANTEGGSSRAEPFLPVQGSPRKLFAALGGAAVLVAIAFLVLRGGSDPVEAMDEETTAENAAQMEAPLGLPDQAPLPVPEVQPEVPTPLPTTPKSSAAEDGDEADLETSKPKIPATKAPSPPASKPVATPKTTAAPRPPVPRPAKKSAPVPAPTKTKRDFGY